MTTWTQWFASKWKSKLACFWRYFWYRISSCKRRNVHSKQPTFACSVYSRAAFIRNKQILQKKSIYFTRWVEIFWNILPPQLTHFLCACALRIIFYYLSEPWYHLTAACESHRNPVSMNENVGWMDSETTREWVTKCWGTFAFSRRMLVWDSFRGHMCSSSSNYH